MLGRLTTLERAYELARSGECSSVSEVKSRLKAERFTDIAGHLYGPSVMGDLRRLCRAARDERGTSVPPAA